MTSHFVHNGKASQTRAVSFEANVIEAMAEWCDALQGGTSLDEAFAGLAAGFGAEAGMLVRTHVSDFRPARIATWDRRSASTSAPLVMSFADGYFGRPLARPRSASVWIASTHEDDTGEGHDPALGLWQTRRGLTDFATLVLTGGPPVRDHIELHFSNPAPASLQAAITVVVPTMARTWASRQIGLVSRTVVNHRPSRETERAPGGARGALLNVTNPARLSRSEFRVCLLLSRGLSVLGVAKELSLCESTIRSHLRSIYAKTDTSNLAELVFLLLSPAKHGDQFDRRSA